MNYKTRMNLLHDINAIFDSVVYELCSAKDDWIEIHLAYGKNITACDFPHLLTIVQGYNVMISIFTVDLNKLGIIFTEVK